MSFFPANTPTSILCCLCGTQIPPNPSNMCVNCIRTQVDITDGIPKQVYVTWCKGCGRYHVPPNAWIEAQLESRELLSFCLKRVKGLNKVKLIDAGFVYTEPHSKRLKIKLTVQNEVFNGTILQQVFVIEFIVQNNFCPDCHRREAKDMWSALVQLRQRVNHKRTFLWLEQVILRHQAHSQATRTKEQPEGLDFFFNERSHAIKFVNFLTNIVPCRTTNSKQLISHDIRSNVYTYKYTYSVEIPPICRDDLVCLPLRVANQLSSISPLVLCIKLATNIYFIDPFTLHTAHIDQTYWQNEIPSICDRSSLIEFMVLEIEPGRKGVSMGKYMLADVTVAILSEMDHSSQTYFTTTHLGNLLREGDIVLGYHLARMNFNDNAIAPLKGKTIRSEIILVRKQYQRKGRKFLLERMEKEPMGEHDSKHLVNKQEQDLEMFVEDLVEDPELRAGISLYKNPNFKDGMAIGDENEDDAPDVDVSELIDAVQGMSLQ